MNIKRYIITVLVVLSATVAPLQSAHAEGVYFGVNLEFVAGSFNTDRDFQVSPVPLPGLEIGYDFGDVLKGFGIRTGFNTILFVSHLFVDGFYRFVLDDTGSNAYLGLGYDNWNVAFSYGGLKHSFHALIGYEWRFNPAWATSIEATPGLGFDFPAFSITIRAGLVWRPF
jgi:hypothetical protein